MPFAIVPGYRRSYWSGPADTTKNTTAIIGRYMYQATSNTVYYSTNGTNWYQHSTFDSAIQGHSFSNFYEAPDGELFAYGDGTGNYYCSNTPISRWTGASWVPLPSVGYQVRIQTMCAQGPYGLDGWGTVTGYGSTAGNPLIALASTTYSNLNASANDHLFVFIWNGSSWTKSGSWVDQSAVGGSYRSGTLMMYVPPNYYTSWNGAASSSVCHFYGSQGGIVKSTDGGYSWTEITTIAGNTLRQIVQCDNYIIASTTTGIMYSSDVGVTWTQVNFGESCDIRGISYSPVTGNIIAISYGGYNPDKLAGAKVWRSNTGTIGTWTKISGTYFDSQVPYDLWSCAYFASNNAQFFAIADIGGGYVYYCQDSQIGTDSWLRVSQTPTGQYGSRIYGRSYVDTKTNYLGNASFTKNTYSLYPNDVEYYAQWSAATPATLYYQGNFDDGYFQDLIPIGFDWTYNGSTYQNFVLNTNGQIQFNNFSGGIDPASNMIGILGHVGDLRFTPPTAPTQTLLTTNGPVSSTYGILTPGADIDVNTTGSYNPPTTFSDIGWLATPTTNYLSFTSKQDFAYLYPRKFFIDGYTTTDNVYHPIATCSITLIPGRETRMYEIPGTNVKSIRLNNTSGNYPSIQKAELPVYMKDSPSLLFKKSISWVDNGVTHNILRIHVRGTFYTSSYINSCSSYRVNLYKCGAIQHISVSLTPYSVMGRSLNYAYGIGPYPSEYSKINQSTRCPNTFTETCWVSYDNGASWSHGVQNSTIVNTGPAVFTMSGDTPSQNNLSLEYLKRAFQSNRISEYSTTNTVQTKYYSSNYSIGLNMHAYLSAYINNAASSGTNEDTLRTIFGSQYSIITGSYWSKYGGGGNYYRYVYYGDVTDDGSINSGDANDLYYIARGMSPVDGDSYSGANRLISYMMGYGSDFVEWCVLKGILKGNTTGMNSLYNTVPPGVGNVPLSLTNFKVSQLGGIGPLATQNIQAIKTYGTSTDPEWSWYYDSLTPDIFTSDSSVPQRTPRSYSSTRKG